MALFLLETCPAGRREGRAILLAVSIPAGPLGEAGFRSKGFHMLNTYATSGLHPAEMEPPFHRLAAQFSDREFRIDSRRDARIGVVPLA